MIRSLIKKLWIGYVCLMWPATMTPLHTQDSATIITPERWARIHKIDVQHIDLDLRLDWKTKSVEGYATIILQTRTVADRIELDGAFLTIHRIETGDGTPLRYTYDGSDRDGALQIQLDRTLGTGEILTLTVFYKTGWVNYSDPNNLWGSNGKGIRFFEPTFSEPRRRKQAWSISEYTSNRYWFPGHDTPSDLRTTTFSMRVDTPFTVIANGALLRTEDHPDGTRTFHWRMDTPYANHRTSFVAGRYSIFRQMTDGVVINNYSYPDEYDATVATVERLPDMMRFYSEFTGQSYPFSQYAQVFVQDLPWGMENTTASTLTENMVDDHPTHTEFLFLWDMLEGEALAMQWFGSYVPAASWEDIWLNRAFARYLSCMYDEYKNGRDEFLLWQLAFQHNTYLSDWASGIRLPVVARRTADEASLVTGNHTYLHGASVLHMLRKHVGDTAWKKILQHYVLTYGGRPVQTEDLRRSVEAVTGEPMDWFFDQWLYRTGHPVFTVTKEYHPGEKALTLTVRQIQSPDTIASVFSQNRWFQGKMEIAVDDRIETIWIKPQSENVFRLACERAPRRVIFDYEGTWIKEATFEKTFSEWIDQFTGDGDILARWDAMTRLSAMASDSGTSLSDKQNIYAAFRTVIGGTAYWRLRYMATLQLQSLIAPPSNPKLVLDNETRRLLLTVIRRDSMWCKTAAISLLGSTRDPSNASLFIDLLRDPKDRVVNAAAIALGKTKHSKAFDALSKLTRRPSWKNQSLISALNGLRELGDARGADIAVAALSDRYAPRWTLVTPVWDFRIAAAQTLVALNQSAKAYPIIVDRFQKAMEENDINDILNNALLITTLADPRGKEIFDALKAKFKNDANTMTAVTQYENQFLEALKKK